MGRISSRTSPAGTKDHLTRKVSFSPGKKGTGKVPAWLRTEIAVRNTMVKKIE
jgi:hypothetical protein